MATAIAAPAATTPAGPTLPAQTLSKGDVTATPGFNTTPAEVTAAKAAGFTPVASTSTVSPTVISDTNIRDSVIPSLIDRASNLSPTPTTTGIPAPGANAGNQNGNNGQANPGSPSDTSGADASNPGADYGVDSSDLDYGDIYNKVFGTESAAPQDPATTSALQSLQAMQSSTDAAYSTQISTMLNQYTTYLSNFAHAQSSADEKETNFLVAGKGGSNAFRTSTGHGVMQTLINNQVQNLADYQTKENNAIAKIQDAQSKSDYATMAKETDILDKIQTDKKSLADKISTQILEANKSLAAQKLKVTNDNAIADVFTSGTTDPESIMQAVNAQGLNVSLSDVNTALNDISNGDVKGLTGSVGEYYSMKAAGTLPSSVSSLPANDQLKAFIDLEKTSTAKTAKTTKPLYTTTSGQAITQSDIEAGVTKLDGSKGPDGYVDPKLYLAMYQHWEDAGLPPEDFTKAYPPKYYIDPTDTTLPSYLRPTAPKAAKAPKTPSSSTSSSSISLPPALMNVSTTTPTT